MIKFKRLLKSFFYAGKGFLRVLREEQNLRVQSFFAVLALYLAWYFHISSLEWAFIVFAIALVFLMEVVNSAVERVTDVLKPRINSYVKEIKDIMAAAVLLAAITAVVIGVIIFYPYFRTL